jgi:hypothetical protein
MTLGARRLLLGDSPESGRFASKPVFGSSSAASNAAIRLSPSLPKWRDIMSRSRLVWLRSRMTLCMIRPVAITPGAIQFAVTPSDPISCAKCSIGARRGK